MKVDSATLELIWMVESRVFGWGTEVDKVPHIPLPEDITLENLKKAMGVEELTLVTLPISKIPAESRNRRIYNENAVRGLVEQVNRLRPEGHWGHGSFFGGGDEKPAVRWLNAMVDENTKIAWGLALPLTEDARRHFAVAEAAGSQVGTSLMATGFRWELDPEQAEEQGVLPIVNSIELAKIDLVNPMMVGVPHAASAPVTRQESIGGEPVTIDTQHPPPAPPAVADKNGTALAAALEKIDNLEPKIKERDEACTLLGIKSEDSLPLAVRRMQAQMNTMKAENISLLESHIDSQLAEKVKIAEFRPMIKALVVNTPNPPTTKAEADNAVQTALETEMVKAVLKSGLASSMGDKHNAPVEHKQDAERDESFLEEKPA